MKTSIRKAVLIALLSAGIQPALVHAVDPKTQATTAPSLRAETKQEHDARMKWWREARFGLFIHWGVYAVRGHGEWAQWNEQIPVDEYAKLADQFHPDKFNADEWAAIAKSAGVKYAVLTARHHDGFCLFDSQSSYRDFTSMKTAAHRDFIAEYTTAFRKVGLGVGLYYSPLDWRFPGFFMPGIYRENAEALKDQTYRQVHELLTNYGQIDVLWWDGGSDDWLGLGGLEWNGAWHQRDVEKHYTGKPLWEADRLNGMVRSLQPRIIVDDRAGNFQSRGGHDWPGDFDTREGDGKLGDFQSDRPWELCTTIAPGSWGWRPNRPVKSLVDCIHLLVNTAGRDGNLLLNIGPKADGEIEPLQVARLKEIGDWLGKYGQSIYATRGGPFKPADDIVSTCAGNAIFIHLLKLSDAPITLPPILRKILNSTVLTGGTVAVKQDENQIELTVKPASAGDMDVIVKLELDGSAEDIKPVALGDPGKK
jgi:alpha-L-fucosidase